MNKMNTPFKSELWNLAANARDNALLHDPNDQISALAAALEVIENYYTCKSNKPEISLSQLITNR